MDRKYRPRIVNIFFWISSCSLLHCVCDWAEVLFTFWNDLDAAYLHMYDEKVLNHAYFFSQTRLFFRLRGGKGQIHQINTFSYFPSWLFSYQQHRVGVCVNTLHGEEFIKVHIFWENHFCKISNILLTATT